jgi:ATP phosphoribosyltransferase regulatory subunit
MNDLLAPEAESEAAVVARLMAVLSAHGYERVKPPLVEFEASLLSGGGAAMATDTFRLIDPMAQRMIGVRADMTPQIARIAATRLRGAQRPLRLSYAGQVLRVRGSEIRPERQVGQAGAELIGAAGTAADVEAIAVAAEALAAIGVTGLSVDLTLPTLVPLIALSCGLTEQHRAALRAALDHKDVAAVMRLAETAGPLLSRLVAAAGPAPAAREALDRLDLPPLAEAERTRLGAVLDGLYAAIPELRVTVDPVENRGFEYHTGISFTFFARGAPGRGPLGELGRGGRYLVDGAEPATGFTLYTDTILRTLPAIEPMPRLLLPLGVAGGRGRALREAGWVTVAALEPAADWRAEARRLGCGWVLVDDMPSASG